MATEKTAKEKMDELGKMAMGDDSPTKFKALKLHLAYAHGKPRQPDQQEQTEALQEIRAILVEQSGELAEILDYIRLRAPRG